MNIKTDLAPIKSKMGVVPQEDGFDPDLNVFENLYIFGELYGLKGQALVSRIEELLFLFQLDEKKSSPIWSLSGGMKKRLCVARGLLHKPKLLFLDEPTVGIDPQARFWLWNYLQNLKNEGVTLFLTTHYMEEAQSLCDRIAILDKGKILDLDSPANLIQKYVGQYVVEIHLRQEDIEYFSHQLKQKNYPHHQWLRQLHIFCRDREHQAQLLSWLQSTQKDSLNYTSRMANLNDVFFKVSGTSLHEGEG